MLINGVNFNFNGCDGGEKNCVYCIFFEHSGKVYIGQTRRQLKKRLQEHVVYGESLVSMAMSKYKECTVTIIAVCENQEELNNMEVTTIAAFNSMSPNGYNLSAGGNNIYFSEESKTKMSTSHIGKVLSDEHKQNISRSLTGKPHTEEHNENVSKGKKASMNDETRKKISEGLTGRTFSEEHIKNLSLSHKDQKPTDKCKKASSDYCKSRTGELNPLSQKVLAMPDNKVFNSMRECREYYKISKPTLHAYISTGKIHLKSGQTFTKII